jgi:DNA-directed RNA polymerase specialized sigma subunit
VPEAEVPKKKAKKKATRRRVNPLDEALNAKEKLAAQRRAEDLQLWQTWRANPSQQTLRPLMRRMEPIIRDAENRFKAPNVNRAAFRSNVKTHILDAFDRLDPEKGAVRTFVGANVKRALRFNAQHQNYAYIPEGQTAYIGALDRAREELMEDNGTEPSHNQMAQFINQRPDLLGNKKKLTPRTVARIQGSRRKDIVSSSIEGDIAPIAATRNEAVLGLLPATLTPDELQVFNHIYGQNGAPRINSTNALAKRLGKHDSQISRLKSSIAKKYKQYL